MTKLDGRNHRNPIPRTERSIFPKSIARFLTSSGALSNSKAPSERSFTRKLFPRYVERCIGFIERTGSDTDEIWLGILPFPQLLQQHEFDALSRGPRSKRKDRWPQLRLRRKYSEARAARPRSPDREGRGRGRSHGDWLQARSRVGAEPRDKTHD